MKDTLQKLAVQGRDFYRGLPTARKISLLVIVLATFLAFGIIAFFISHEEKVPLIQGAAPEDVQAITAALRDSNVPCTVSAGGDTVLVPEGSLDQARLELASVGLPRGGSVGFELFDRDSIGVTSFREQINFRRALEGELARTIRSLTKVRGARVHIVLPRQTIFKEDAREPSASVVINLDPGQQLDKRRLKGIRYLVASAVEGMQPERVTVLDGSGAVLARMGDGGSADGGGEYMEFQRNVEKRIENRILGLLEPLLGAGKVVAQVTADVDFRHMVETTERFDPERTVVRSEQRSSEKRSNQEVQAKGVAGTQSNLPGGGPSRPSADNTKYERKSETINYEVDKRVLRTESPRGSLSRLSVAVVVDGTYKVEVAGEGEEKKTSYQSRPPEEMKRLTDLVKKAVGFDPARGDQVQVSNIAFQGSTEQVPQSSWLDGVDLIAILRIVGLVALGLALVFLVVRPFVKGLTSRSAEILLPGDRPTTVLELEEKLASSPETAGLLGSGETEDVGVQARILAKENPQRAVQVLRYWMSEGNQ